MFCKFLKLCSLSVRPNPKFLLPNSFVIEWISADLLQWCFDTCTQIARPWEKFKIS